MDSSLVSIWKVARSRIPGRSYSIEFAALRYLRALSHLLRFCRRFHLHRPLDAVEGLVKIATVNPLQGDSRVKVTSQSSLIPPKKAVDTAASILPVRDDWTNAGIPALSSHRTPKPISRSHIWDHGLEDLTLSIIAQYCGYETGSRELSWLGFYCRLSCFRRVVRIRLPYRMDGGLVTPLIVFLRKRSTIGRPSALTSWVPIRW